MRHNSCILFLRKNNEFLTRNISLKHKYETEVSYFNQECCNFDQF